MAEILSFSQCVTQLMQKYHLTTASVAALAGGRSELKKVLADTASPAKRELLFQALQDSGIFSQGDCEKLAFSLEVSRVGLVNYRFQQSIEEILHSQPQEDPTVLCTENGLPLRNILSDLRSADALDILCVNSCFRSLISALLPLFERKEKEIRMWHLIHTNAFASTASNFVAVSFPLLFDDRYLPYGLELSADAEVPALGGNMLAVRAHFGADVKELFFSIASAGIAIELPHASEAHAFSFLSKILHALTPQPFPLKEAHSDDEDYSLLCMNYLSHELNRATYSVANDIYFHQTPSDIAIAALKEKGVFSEEEVLSLIDRTLAIHEQRYQNQYLKKKDTYQIMTLKGCERFLKTGLCTDHFFGFRAFTVEERKRIFGEMIHYATENPNFVPLLMKDHRFEYRYNLICYDKLGVSLDMTDTDYDIGKGHRSVFLMFPEFTKQYMEYYQSIFVREKCHSPQVSLQLLEEMFERFCKENP